MRKGRLSTQMSGKGQSEDVEDREPCTCDNTNFVSHVCRQCQKLICVNCRSGEHKHHVSDKISVAAGELRNNIGENVSKQTESNVLDSVQKGKEVIVKMIKELLTIESTEIDKINKHVIQLHEELDEIRMDLVGRVNTIVRLDIEYLKDADVDLDKTAQYIKLMHDAAQSMLEKANDIEIIKKGYSFCKSLNDISKTTVVTPIKGQAFSVQFVADECKKQSLQNMFGELSIQPENDQANALPPTHSQTITSVPGPSTITATSGMAVTAMTRVSCFSVSGVFVVIHGICTLADDKCWYSDYCSDDIKLVGMMGTRHRTVTVGGGCAGITTTDGSSVFVTCYNRSIKKISTNQEDIQFQPCLSFDPRGLTFVPATGELLVCGGTNGVFSVTKTGVHKILTDVMFQFARGIAVNNNGDICVTDKNNVFIFNSDKRHVGTYDGHGTSIQNKMDACGVTCDSRGDFIIADCNNHVLHFINHNHDNVSIYDTTNDCEQQPYCVDISQSGRLWVSFGDDKICVYDII